MAQHCEVYCDFCNPKGKKNFHRGFKDSDEKTALACDGWLKLGYQLKCPDCQKDETMSLEGVELDRWIDKHLFDGKNKKAVPNYSTDMNDTLLAINKFTSQLWGGHITIHRWGFCPGDPHWEVKAGSMVVEGSGYRTKEGKDLALLVCQVIKLVNLLGVLSAPIKADHRAHFNFLKKLKLED